MSGGSFHYIGRWMWDPHIDSVVNELPKIVGCIRRDYSDAPGARELVAKLEAFVKRCECLVVDFEKELSEPLTTVDRVYSSDDGPEHMRKMLVAFGKAFPLEGSPCPDCGKPLVRHDDGYDDWGLVCDSCGWGTV